MRIMFATTAGAGHFGPMVPLAQACVAAGHDVVVAAPGSFADQVQRAGLPHAGFADVPPEVLGPVFGRLPELSQEEANQLVIAEVFGRLDAQAALPGVSAIVADWSPGLIVREPCELASLVAAEAAEIPHAQVSIGMTSYEGIVMSQFVPPLGELAALAGLDADRAVRAMYSVPRFSCVPAVLDDARGDPTSSTRTWEGPMWRYRSEPLQASGGALPPSWGNPDHPLVYVSFGSVAATVGPFGGIYPAVVETLADQPVRVLMTTGTGLDPADLDPLPANACVEQWWPQDDVLPHAAAVVGHGGFGTTMAALAAGVPQVVIPLFAGDQFVNAEHIAAVGAGVRLDGGPDAAAALAPALAALLSTASYSETAREVADQMDALRPATECVPLLGQIAGA